MEKYFFLYRLLFSFRSGKKLLIQQQELEKRTREYNDYHSKLIHEKQLNLSPVNSLKNGENTNSLILHDQHHTSAPTTMSRNTSFVQSSGKSTVCDQQNGWLIVQTLRTGCCPTESPSNKKQI